METEIKKKTVSRGHHSQRQRGQTLGKGTDGPEGCDLAGPQSSCLVPGWPDGGGRLQEQENGEAKPGLQGLGSCC